MLEKKKFTFKLIASLLCLLLIVPTTSVTALDTLPGLVAAENSIEITFNTILSQYFDAREAMNAQTISDSLNGIVISGMINDELSRLVALNASGVIEIQNSYSIDSCEIYDIHGIVTVTESITYFRANSIETESVTHTITIALSEEDGTWVLLSDRYIEPNISFKSCAYVPDMQTVVPYANSTADEKQHELKGDYAYDLAQIALTQEGYLEKASQSNLNSKTGNAGDKNYTKYGAWYGANGNVWCAMFVAWCANKAGISTNIIRKTAGVAVYRNDYKDAGRYYTSIANGGTYIPQMGDLFFYSLSSHIGIVTSVDVVEGETVVTVVHGNWSNKVVKQQYNPNDPFFEGFASPDYENGNTNRHNYVCTDHSTSLLHTCSYCGKEATGTLSCDHTNTMEHSCSLCSETITATWLGDHPNSTDHTCSACGYVQTGTLSQTVEYAHNASSHWLTCTVCNANWNSGSHFWVPINNGNEGYNCRICERYTVAITLNKLLPLIQSKE